MTWRTPHPALRRWGPLLADLLADLACVLAFAVGGRDTHDAGASGWVVLAIVWPYALAALLAHGWLRVRGGRTRRVRPEGLLVLATTYLLGMVLRATSGRGLAPGFLVVAALFLALTMLGWRAAAALLDGRRASRSAQAERADHVQTGEHPDHGQQ